MPVLWIDFCALYQFSSVLAKTPNDDFFANFALVIIDENCLDAPCAENILRWPCKSHFMWATSLGVYAGGIL